MKDELKPRMNWPGKRAGIRAPDVGETPLSWEEVKFAFGVDRITGSESVHTAPMFDDVDTWSTEQRIVPQSRWVRRNAAPKEPAHPFGGLLR